MTSTSTPTTSGTVLPRLLGLHHVTATVDDAQRDLDFCLGLLGLRLIKKTVNFDNHGVYHFYYGNHAAQPGTLWTTFPYRGKGVAVGEKGAGQIVRTTFSIPPGSLATWRSRLDAAGVPLVPAAARFGEQVLAFQDSSGIVFELTESHDARPGSSSVLEDDMAIRGLFSVTVLVRAAAPTVAFMTEALGYEVVARMPGRTRLTVNGAAAGHYIDVLEDAAAPEARNGLGTVHHVAVGIGSEAEMAALRDALAARGHKVSPIVDRKYFKSLYFRLPGNIGFEVATAGPGFTVDETPDRLGRELKLPPDEEGNREAVEAALPAVTYA